MKSRNTNRCEKFLKEEFLTLAVENQKEAIIESNNKIIEKDFTIANLEVILETLAASTKHTFSDEIKLQGRVQQLKSIVHFK